MNGDKIAVATFKLTPKTILIQGSKTGFDTLQLAYASATSTIYALNSIFSGDWTLDKGKDIVLTGGYQADYAARTGFTTLSGKLTIKNGSLRVDGLKVK